MRRLALAAAVLLAAGPAAVHAEPMELTGHPCALWWSFGDDDGDWTGVLTPTPQKLSHVAASPVVSGSLRCTVQLDGNQHSDPDLVSTQGPVTPAVAVAPPLLMTYHLADEFAEVAVCAQVDVPGGATYYWHDYANVGHWSTDPESDCTSTIAMYVEPPYYRRVYNIVETVGRAGDATACPRLAALAPGAGPVTVDAEGDVYAGGGLVFDCPPYEAS